jgi:hypothetical protein
MQLGNIPKYSTLALLVASAVVLTALGAKHKGLSREFLQHRRSDARLQEGMYVPVFQAASVAGDSITVGEPAPGQFQVLILLTSTCPYCRASLPYWTQLTQQVRKSGMLDATNGVVALTPEPDSVATAYASTHEVTFPLVALPSRRLASLFRADLIPQTIVIDHHGRVVLARPGVLDTEAAVDSIVSVTMGPNSGSAASGGGGARGLDATEPGKPATRGAQ